MRILTRKPKETGRDYALRVIRENIVSMDLLPGTSFSESELANQLGLSRTPVREAIMELSSYKVIDVCPHKKSTVTLINYSVVDEARFLRETLDCAVAREACEMATVENIDGLKNMTMLQDFYLRSPNGDEFFRLDASIHRELFRITYKMAVFTLLDRFSIHIERIVRAGIDGIDKRALLTTNNALIEAIENHDPDKASESAKDHLNCYIRDLIIGRKQRSI